MVNNIKIYLKENSEVIIKILNYFKYKDISKYKNEIRCAKPTGDNSSTVRIRLNEYLTSNDFSLAYKGDLFGLISKHTNSTYGEVINMIKLIIDEKITRSENKCDLFDGFFEETYSEYTYDIQTYNNNILNTYNKSWNMRFLKDNILPSTQIKFNIGYDSEDNRISIPWLNVDGELVGIMGRINSDEETNYKYLPLIAFPKQFFLFGLFQNKEYIRNNRVYLFESEKSVMQLHSMGIYNSVALGGNSIHKHQIEELLKLNVTEFIICFDEGLEIEVIKSAISSIRECLFMRDEIKIGVMLDRKNKSLPEGSKCSPTDLGKDVWCKLVEKNIIMGR